MLLNSFTFHIPKSTAEAAKLLNELENVKIQAGGTFLLNSLKLLKRKGTKTPEHIISLYKIAELKGVQQTKNGLTIKAMTTIDDLFESDQLTGNYEILKTVCRNISTQPIRNMATVGGNLTCRYTWTEMPAVMIGLNATFHFIDASAQESTLAAEDFFKHAAKTDKLLTHITIPDLSQSRLVYRRVKKTQYIDIPLLSLLINTNIQNNRLNNTRVAVNNCVDFAQRDTKLEDFLNSAKIHPDLGQEALDHLEEKIYDTRSHEYKKYIFRHNIKNAINEIVQGL